MSEISEHDQKVLNATYDLASTGCFSIRDLMDIPDQALFFWADRVRAEKAALHPQCLTTPTSCLQLSKDELIELAKKAIHNPEFMTLIEKRMLAEYVLLHQE